MQTTLENQTADNHTTREEYVAPKVNILESNDGYVLQAEMPGVGKEGLEISLEENEITVTGRRSAEDAVGEALFRERNTADYRRVFELDPAIDAAKISAKLEQGILTVILPKSEQVKPRKITVD